MPSRNPGRVTRSAMVEGVVAVDTGHRVVARQLLRLEIGHWVQLLEARHQVAAARAHVGARTSRRGNGGRCRAAVAARWRSVKTWSSSM